MSDINFTPEEVDVISELYRHWKEQGSWLGVKTINYKYGRDVLNKLLSYRPYLICVEKKSNDDSLCYKLTFEGLLVYPYVREDLELLIRYFRLLIQKFDDNPEIQQLLSAQIEQEMSINKQQSRILREFIYIGQFWGQSASHGDEWWVGVPLDIEDLVEFGPELYLKRHREKLIGEGQKKDAGEISKKDTEKAFLKAFISYSTKDKDEAARIKRILEYFGIEGFLAHDDIEVSEEWKARIMEELVETCIFVPILSQNFKDSEWAPQEVGMAYLSKKLVIPLCLDKTVPFGFISHYQGKPCRGKDTCVTLIKPIVKKFPSLMIPVLIAKLEKIGDFRSAEEVVGLLEPYFQELDQEAVNNFIRCSIRNGQIWLAKECRNKYLPNFIEIHRSQIQADFLKELEYQIKEGRWYHESVDSQNG